jgi:hypothetical protein
MTVPRGTILFTQINSTCQNRIRPPVYLRVFLVSIHCTFHVSQLPRVVRLYGPCHISPCHVSPLQRCHVSQSDSSTCQLSCLVSIPMHHCHVTCMTVHNVRLAATSTLYTLYSLHFFSCLVKRKDPDIFRIQFLFDPIQVALGLY